MTTREQLNAFVRGRTGGVVQTGPFRGMRISEECCWGDGDITPKLLGVYEQELHAVLEEVLERPRPLIVNIGCAEGFYAVGLALRCPRARIIACDTMPEATAITARNAALNNVADRVFLHGACTPPILVALGAENPSLLVCDCEGYESLLLSAPGVAEALARCDLIVECHDFQDPDCTPTVFKALWRTHLIDVVYPGGRDPHRFSMLSGFSDDDRWQAVNERRPRLMNWLVCRAR